VLLGGKDLFGELKDAWAEIIQHIERFKGSDMFLISTPMWNYTIPYMLKKYIDIILQPRYLFRYTPTGVEGLVNNKKMIVLTSRGGEYLSEAGRKLDFQEPYLRAIFGLCGITDITFVNAQPMDMGKENQETNLQKAIEQAKLLAAKL
jgi:FMN-dependent NADH-azoreductase